MAELCHGGIVLFVYCLFCETAKCDYVMRSAKVLFQCQAIYPKMIQHTWRNGKMADIVHDLLPGYVFLYNDERLPVNAFRTIKGVIRCLVDKDQCYELSGENERFALMLLRKNGIIGKTKVFQEGQLIHICEGAFEGAEARILRVNHRNSRMQLEFIFDDKKIKTWVEYEVTEQSD